jgi:hypothetical protein
MLLRKFLLRAVRAVQSSQDWRNALAQISFKDSELFSQARILGGMLFRKFLLRAVS